MLLAFRLGKGRKGAHSGGSPFIAPSGEKGRKGRTGITGVSITKFGGGRGKGGGGGISLVIPFCSLKGSLSASAIAKKRKKGEKGEGGMREMVIIKQFPSEYKKEERERKKK